MTVDEKITRLQESAMQEARSKGNAIVEQHKKALTHVFEQHKAEALIQADTRIKAEKTSVKQQLGMANSKAALELKRELGAAQKRLKKQLFKEVEEKLSAYMKTEKYQDLVEAKEAFERYMHEHPLQEKQVSIYYDFNPMNGF